MPFINGKRVTLDEWRAAHPSPPLYGYTADGERFTRYPGDRPEIEPVSGLVRRIAGDRKLRTAAAIADAMGLDSDDPEVLKILVGEHEPTPHMSEDVGGTNYPSEPASPRMNPALAARGASHGSSAPSEDAATRFSSRRGLPRHRKSRRSQTPEGRRERLIRAKADRLNITYKQAEALTPRRQPRKDRS